MQGKKILEEFKTFALKVNIVDLAIGVIIGSSFSALINSIVKDLIMPVVGFITGGIDFSNKFIQLSGEHKSSLAEAQVAGATIAYGHFITLFINFLIIAWILFLVVKFINASKLGEGLGVSTLPNNEKLLTEIRDLLKEQSYKK